MKSNAFIRGTILLIVFNLIGKVIGAVYRIPLAKILGAVGMGQYQLTFPIYCLLLTIATTGVPISISKMVAEFNSENRFKDSKRVLGISILILIGISLFGSLFVVFGAKIIARLQANTDAYICYYGIAPAILFVGLLSAFRGYFQGNLYMFPTALSGLIEQVSKMIFGLFLANKLSVFGMEYAVFGALLGVSISEFLAFVFLVVCYAVFIVKNKNKHSVEPLQKNVIARRLVSLSIPITLGGMVGPFTSMIDSLLVVNLLMFSGFSSVSATTLLGIQSGVVEPLINIPIVIAVSISTVLLPNISKLGKTKNTEEIKGLVEKAFQLTLSVALACSICFVIFGDQILNLLYGSNFDQSELTVALKLLFVGCVNLVCLSLVQVSAGILQGLGKSKIPLKSLIIGGTIKIVLDFVLVAVPEINILGASISGFVCYLTVFLLNYKHIKMETNASIFKCYFNISLQECLVCVSAFAVNILCLRIFSGRISLIVAGCVAVLVFFVSYYWLFLKSDIKDMRASKQLS